MQTKLEVGIIGQSPDYTLLRNIEWKFVKSMGQLLTYVNNLSIDEEVKKELVIYIKKYPEGSLNYIAKNFRFITNKCIEKVMQKNNLSIELPEIKQEEQVVQPKVKVLSPLPQRASLSEILEGEQLSMVKENQPKWTVVNAEEIYKERKDKEAKLNKQYAVKKESKSFDQVKEEVQKDLDQFLNDQEFMSKINGNIME